MALYDIWYTKGTEAVFASSIGEALETAALLSNLEIIKIEKASK